MFNNASGSANSLPGFFEELPVSTIWRATCVSRKVYESLARSDRGFKALLSVFEGHFCIDIPPNQQANIN